MTYESEEKLEAGYIVEVFLRNNLRKGIIYSHCEKPQFLCEKIKDILDFYFPLNYQKIIKFIRDYYFCSYGEAASLFIPFKKEQKFQDSEITTDVILSQQQTTAYSFSCSNDASLLFGDTGSGKTEVYMKLFENMINNGKSSIFLMPEISLTPQMQKRLKSKFGDLVEVWHSRLSKKKKETLLERLYNGEIKIIAGPRSVLFLPLKNLGLIVVDEEHDDSYKAGNRPRYNAKDLAIYFGKVLNAKVVLGSATPSINSYQKIPHIRLRGNYFESENKFLFEESPSKITPFIEEMLHDTLSKEEQVIFFVPTRANYKYLSCNECGSFVECPFCSVGMSLHKDKNILKCHYCNLTQKIPQICPSCKSSDLRVGRIGTAEVVDELSAIFPKHRFEKFDRDAITTETKLKKVLKAFNDKEIDVLVGTQMLSKGHDYHNVTLAVILGIDNLLAASDFRARERAVSLLIQIAGRSGRKNAGKVLIQTTNIDFFKMYLNDYELFLKDEIKYREGLYPPFKKMLRFIVSDKKSQKALENIEKLNQCLSNKPNIEIIGYGEAPIFKISSKFRYHLLLRSDSTKALLQAAYSCKCKGCEVDIDPISFS